MQKLDALPTQGADWTCNIVTVAGNRFNDDGQPMPAEKLEFWRRNPVDVTKELISRPEFAKMMRFAPERVYGDHECQKRLYDEMSSMDWWWETQVRRFSSD